MTRKKNIHEVSTAYHEAGHAVASRVLRLNIRGITIIPDNETLGTASVLHKLRERIEFEVSPRDHVQIEDLAVICFAGDAAEKKFNPRRRDGGHNDRHTAVDLLGYISGSNEILEARLKVAYLQAVSLVNCRWKEITAVATALLERKTLTRDEVRQACISTMPPIGATLEGK